jgi:hypothetical protein
MIWIAIVVTIAVCIAHHQGLPQAIAQTILKVAKCYKCLSFWCVLAVLLLYGCNILVSLLLSIIMSYLAHYLNLGLKALNNLYNWLWQKGDK